MFSFSHIIFMSMVLKLGATQIFLGWHSMLETEHIAVPHVALGGTDTFRIFWAWFREEESGYHL